MLSVIHSGDTTSGHSIDPVDNIQRQQDAEHLSRCNGAAHGSKNQLGQLSRARNRCAVQGGDVVMRKKIILVLMVMTGLSFTGLPTLAAITVWTLVFALQQGG